MIPFLKPIVPSVERYQQHIYQMHENCWFSNGGRFVCQFERDLQRYLKTDREIVVVNNATTGLILAITALEIEGPILVPSFTFAATVGAIEWCGLDYEYVDIDATWNMDIKKAEDKLKTGRYAAMMPVHTFGAPCDVKGFERLAAHYNVKLIFDAAPAIGSSYCGQPVGNFGDAEVFSLHATKTLPIGEGGFISFHDPVVAERARQIKNFGFQSDRVSHSKGLNGKMPEILAAIGIEAIKDLDQHIRNRQAYVELYKKLLGNNVAYQEINSNCVHSYQCFSVLVEDGEGVAQEMNKRQIQVRRYFCNPVHTHPAYVKDADLPNTTAVSSKIINLPLYSIMDDFTIEHVCQNLKEII